jgi:hypothetical protein
VRPLNKIKSQTLSASNPEGITKNQFSSKPFRLVSSDQIFPIFIQDQQRKSLHAQVNEKHCEMKINQVSSSKSSGCRKITEKCENFCFLLLQLDLLIYQER